MEVNTVQINCNSCGVTFFVIQKMDLLLRSEHRTFYCPNGHTLFYPQLTDKDREIKSLTRDNSVLQNMIMALKKEGRKDGKSKRGKRISGGKGKC